ncbi:hypothetical protein LSAT2_009080, partial [Lamellibrachia satsuma]
MGSWFSYENTSSTEADVNLVSSENTSSTEADVNLVLADQLHLQLHINDVRCTSRLQDCSFDAALSDALLLSEVEAISNDLALAMELQQTQQSVAESLSPDWTMGLEIQQNEGASQPATDSPLECILEGALTATVQQSLDAALAATLQQNADAALAATLQQRSDAALASTLQQSSDGA